MSGSVKEGVQCGQCGAQRLHPYGSLYGYGGGLSSLEFAGPIQFCHAKPAEWADLNLGIEELLQIGMDEDIIEGNSATVINWAC